MAHFLITFLPVAIMCAASRADNYVTKYDNINLGEIFSSQRLMDNYMNCLKAVGPCTPDGRELKDNLPDALMSDCAKCSEKQRVGSDEVIKFIIANRPDDFAILEQLYDPTGEYRRKYLKPDEGDESAEQHAKPEERELSSGGDRDDIETEAHATEHISSASSVRPSQDHDHGEGQTDASEN
uniref:Uncharacterized protein n=1 Tax=Anopheles dirus TaxID=7168 RepID=A0A182NU81_9DIPT